MILKRKTFRIVLPIGLLALMVLSSVPFSAGSSATGLAQERGRARTEIDDSAQRQAVRDETTNLAGLIAAYMSAGTFERDALSGPLSQAAEVRFDRLEALIESDPGEVLRVALPSGMREGLPPAFQRRIEQRVDFSGTLEIEYECWEDRSRLNYFVESGGRRFSLRFAGGLPGDLLSGARVRVRGVRIGDRIALESSGDGLQATEDGAFQALATVLSNTFGEQKVLVILVNFEDNKTQPYTLNHARSVMETVNNYYKEASYQQTWLATDVVGWYTLPLSSSDCDSYAIASYAKQAAAAAGIDVSSYRRLIYAFPKLSSCGFVAKGTVGGNPSQAWINTSFALRVVGHELGHNFGLYHARALECGSVEVGSSCSTIEYGSILDILGKSPNTGHVHSYQKERVGWLDYGGSPSITMVQSSGTYWIDPAESMGTGPKALKIYQSTNSSGRNVYYYVEVRRPVGFDSYLSKNNNVMNGVTMHLNTESEGRSNYLLDMTPETSSWDDPALVVGRSYYDPNTGMTLSPISVSDSGAAVSVSFGAQSCEPANPGLSVSPSQSQWVSAGTTVSYTVSVTNKDNGGCGRSSFDLQAGVPSGWSASFSSSQLSLDPGASASTTLKVTSPSWAAEGFHDVGVAVVNSGDSSFSASASVTYVVMSAPTVEVSSDQSSYSSNQTAYITAVVSAGGSPVSGASVSFVLTKPNGATKTGSATTGSNGSAVFKYKFNRRHDPAGEYRVRATASVNGASATGETSFVLR